MNYRATFDTQGYFAIPEFFSPSQMNRLEGLVDPVYSQWIEQNSTEIFEQKLVNMHSLTKGENFQGQEGKRIDFFDAILPASLTELMTETFGEDIYFHNTQLFFDPPNPKRLPYWHRDLQFSPAEDEVQRREQGTLLSLHVRIPLTEEKGLALVPGTHQRWDTPLERSVRLEQGGHLSHEDLPGAEIIHLNRGDILVFDAQMLHKGSYSANHDRKALDLCLGNQHSLTSPYLDASVLPTEDEIQRLKNKAFYRRASHIVESTR